MPMKKVVMYATTIVANQSYSAKPKSLVEWIPSPGIPRSVAYGHLDAIIYQVDTRNPRVYVVWLTIGRITEVAYSEKSHPLSQL